MTPNPVCPVHHCSMSQMNQPEIDAQFFRCTYEDCDVCFYKGQYMAFSQLTELRLEDFQRET
jgi:hypothetical protein